MSNADLMRELVQSFVAHDYDRIVPMLDDECEFTDVASGETASGREAVVDEFRKWETGFPDMDISPLTIVSTESGAAGEFLARGTQTGPRRHPRDRQAD